MAEYTVILALVAVVMVAVAAIFSDEIRNFFQSMLDMISNTLPGD